MDKSLVYEEFQNTVSEVLLYNRSILDVMAKTQECSARLFRFITMTVTSCGCMKINAAKKEIPRDASLNDLKYLLDSHLEGKMCETCRENIETIMGQTLFYLVALCNILDLNLCDVLKKEQQQLKILGLFNLA